MDAGISSAATTFDAVNESTTSFSPCRESSLRQQRFGPGGKFVSQATVTQPEFDDAITVSPSDILLHYKKKLNFYF